MLKYEKPQQKQTSKSNIQKKEAERSVVKSNLTGIPDAMKVQFESISGLSLDDVRIHYNSDKPARLQALAYTQGKQVYVAPGQEKHLGHELGHVVQQKQGRVKHTANVNGFYVNDSDSLEREADNYGAIQRRHAPALNYLKYEANTIPREAQKTEISSDETHKLGTSESDNSSEIIQCKKILNIASGTDISKLVASSPGIRKDVVNSDRGDMLYLSVVIKHFKRFYRYIAKDIAEAGEEAVVQSHKMDLIPKYVNYWFYKILSGNIARLWSIITEVDKDDSLREVIISEQRLYAADNPIESKFFKFGTILDEAHEHDEYDEITVTSGFMVPLSSAEYVQKMISILKPNGILTVVGNVSCLNTNGIKLIVDKTTGEINVDFVAQFKLIKAIKVATIDSRHTLSDDPITGDIYKLVFEKNA